jgi:16S rRNA (uracil1498-N3)-methyltransferase
VLDRFYSPKLTEGAVVELDNEEFHHLAHVLRKQVGDRIALFDGCGRSAIGQIESLGRRGVQVRVEPPVSCDSESNPVLTLATAVPKGDRAKWLIEKLTELNVDIWTPLQTARGIVDPRLPRLEKFQHSVIAACKQCGRNRLLKVHPPHTLQEWLMREQQHGAILIADPQGEPINQALERLTWGPSLRLAAAVGPEGGLSLEELELARQAGAVCVSLGSNILRIETAAIAMAAFLRLR